MRLQPEQPIPSARVAQSTERGASNADDEGESPSASTIVEGRQIQAGCTCLENRIGSRRGRSITDAFLQFFQTLNQRNTHEIRDPLPKPVALSQELQTEPNYPNPTGREAEPDVPTHACRSTNQYL